MGGTRGYDGPALARRTPEPPKDSGADRTPFERDRARVLHSAALRRLAAKTQVVAAGEADFPRTRLTHSLEVAQIGREMGAALGCDPDVVDAAGLAHDLGHPPFGHNGEDALHRAAEPCGGFEGNAQTLRVLTRLEAKVVDADGRSAGLNLTRAVLDAATKYPWPRRPGTRKFGVYADDRPVFDWLRDGSPPAADATPRRCLEAQVMDWADDVAYCVHDVEDGVHAGYVRLELLADPGERAALCEVAAAQYSPEGVGGLGEVLDGLLALPVFTAVAGYDGTQRAQVALKQLTSVVTGRLTLAAIEATRAASGQGPLARYGADLVVPRRARAECALLKGVAARYVMGRVGAGPVYARQQEMLTTLVGLLCDRAPDALDPAFRPSWLAAVDDAGRLRVVVDQVASLTDVSVPGWLARLAR